MATKNSLIRLKKSIKSLAFLGLVLLVVGLVVYVSRSNNQLSEAHPNSCVIPGEERLSRYSSLVTKSCVLNLETANTQALREQGLSGRNALPASQGMLFVFDGIGEHCMWMKDMKFSIDIIWLNSQGIVNKVTKNVSPDTYPQTFCGKDSLFVIEAMPGVSGLPELQLGSHINL